jgi:hypothetical protein
VTAVPVNPLTLPSPRANKFRANSGLAATAVLQGSNDGTNWTTLNAWIGTNTSFTAAGIRKVTENPGYIRAVTTGGTSSSISVVVAVKAMFDKKAY